MNSILLVNPGGAQKNYQALKNDLMAYEPPVWCLMLAGYLMKSGVEVEIFDANLPENDAERLSDKVRKNKYKVVCLVAHGHNPSASTQTMPDCIEIINFIKNEFHNKVKTAILGGYVSALPVKTFELTGADFVIVGEGFRTLEKISNLPLENENLHEIPDILIQVGEGYGKTPPAPLIENLSREIERLPWELVDLENYRCHNWHAFGRVERSPYASLYTTLGCPFDCSFCCIQAPFRRGESLSPSDRNSYRYFEPEWIAREILYLYHEKKIRNIKIADEMFALNHGHVKKIGELLSDIADDLNIWAYSRVDTVSEKMCDALKLCGIKWVCLGIESFDEESLNSVQKAKQIKKVDSAVSMLKRKGISIIGNIIFGLPEDNTEKMKQTLRLVKELELDFVNMYTTMPYPGSALFNSLEFGDKPLEEFSQLSRKTYPMSSRHMAAEDILSFRDQAFKNFFSDKKYLTRLEEKFGLQAREGIEKMNLNSIERDYSSHKKYEFD